MVCKKTIGLFSAVLAAVCAYGAALDIAPFSRTCAFTVSGYTGASALEDFPVLIRISQSIAGFSYADCAANGADLRFTDARGELLQHEIESWNTSGESVVWVKVPRLSGTTTAVYMYYGASASATLPTVTARNVWTKYVTVIHGGSGISDSSPKALAVANGGGVTATAGSGVVGGGLNKSARNSIGVNVPNLVKNNKLSDPGLFTFSGWFKSGASGTSILAASKNAWNGTGFLLLCEKGMHMDVAAQSTHQYANGKGALVVGQWAHVAFSYDAVGKLNTYFNGARIYSNESAKALSHEDRASWSVGSYAMKASTDSFQGDMDEIRFYDGIASADWVKAENDSVTNASFAVAGAATANTAWDCAGGVVSARQTPDGILVNGTLARIDSSASRVSVSLKWGETEALEGGTVTVGVFTAPVALSATFPGTTADATYHFAFVLTPNQGNVVTSPESTFRRIGTEALWRPQSAHDTWDTESWQLGAQITGFSDGWPVVFDGAEQNYMATVKVPSAVSSSSMTVGGAKDYAFTGSRLILADVLVKTGSGTLKPQTAFAEPLNFIVREGVVAYDAAFNFGSVATAGTSTLVVGGGESAARLTTTKELSVGRGAGTSAEVTVKTNGTVVMESSPWLRFGTSPGCTCDVSVERGGLLESGWLMFGSQAAVCTARVAGTVVVRSAPLGVGEGSDSSLVLEPGGRIKARGVQMWNNNPTWGGRTGHATLHVHDGTLELYPVAAYTDYPIINTSLRVTYEDAITFDIPAGGSSSLAASVTNVTAGATGHFVKTGGGDLTVTGDVGGITGAIDVLAGRLIFNKAFADDADVTVNVSEEGAVGCNVAGGAASILTHIPKDSRGTLIIHDNNANETIDLSEYPYLKVAVCAGGGFSGTVIPYGNHYVFDMFGREGALNVPLADADGVPARITLTDSLGGGALVLAADNSGMSGPIMVSGNVRLRLAHAQAAGTGNITLGEGSSIDIAAAVGANFLATRVTQDSRPAFVFISAGGEATDVDLSRFPGCRLGTVGSVSVTQIGAVTPRDGEYTLGGGDTPQASSYSGLTPGVLVDVTGESRKVVVDRPGMVNLSNTANAYSGGTVVTNGGRVYVAGTDGFGAVPAAFDARNIVVDGGVVRQGNANTTIDAKRGLWVGAGGMTLHPWGGYTLTIPGGLGGTGAISVTDNGHLTLPGPYNTYNGAITMSRTASILTIGGADAFSWTSTGGISTLGTVALNATGNATFTDTVSGAGALKKQGTGTLTLARAQTYTGATTVEAGTLRLADGGRIASTSAINNNSDIFVDFAGSAKDAFGNAPIYGPGTVRFAAGSNTTIDRPLPGVGDLAAENGATLDYKVAGSASVTVEDATLALYGTGGTAVSGFADFKLNGTVAMVGEDGNEIQLSSAETYKGGTAFWRKRVSVTRPWVASFTYKTVAPPANPADGFAFFLHNDSRGLNAAGGAGGGIYANGITPSIGAAYNVYNADTAGWLVNGAKTSMTNLPTSAGDISIQDGIDVCVTYDGVGKLVHHVYSGFKYAARTNSVNLLQALGAPTAWIGFSGATGASYCDQRITNFRFLQADVAGAVDIEPSGDASKWRLNGNAAYEVVEGTPAFRITDTSNNQTSVVTRLERVYVGGPFKISGTYHFTAPAGNAADGAAVFLHVNSPMIAAAHGSSLGVGGAGFNNARFTTAYGWGIKIYPSPAIAAITNGVIGTAVTELNGVDPKNMNPMDFTVSYVPGRLSFAVTQDGKTATFSQDVNLVQKFGENFAYLSFSGATGGYNARQYVYGLSLEYEADGTYGAAGYGDVEFRGSDTLRVAAGANEVAEVRTVTFGDNATVGVSASGAANQPYALRADRIEFDVTGAGATPSLSLAPNGSAAGTLQIGAIAYGAKPSLLKITGAASGIDGAKVRIEMPLFNGIVKLLDLTDATGLSLEDFELVTETRPPVKLDLKDGILSAIHDSGTILFFR